MRRFSFHRRNGIMYCQLFNQTTGKYLTARSTGTSDPDEALLVAAEWLRSGIPEGRSKKARPAAEVFTLEAILAAVRAPTFSRSDAIRVLKVFTEREFIDKPVMKGSPAAVFVYDYLVNFWDEHESPYVREERARGLTIGLRHIREMARIVERYWKEPFAGIRLGELRKADVKAALVRLSERGGQNGTPLAAGTVSKAYACLQTACKWAAENDLIALNPCTSVKRIVGKAKERGILEDQELGALFGHAWKDPRARTAFMVAATTGLRRGEVMALQTRDIGEDRLFVRHSWNDDDRLKAPKNGEERQAVLLPEVRAALLDLVDQNPHAKSPESFVFYGADADRPLDGQIISNAFDEALEALHMDPETRKARGISFHSLRHGFAKRMADRLDIERAMKATGHLSAAMLEHYADHKTKEDFAAVSVAANDAFNNVLQFKKGA